MNKKQRICQMLETYIYDVETPFIEELYGVGTTIKIKDIFYSTTTKSVVVDCKIVLGELINEEILDISTAEICVTNAVSLFYPDSKLSITIGWDC